MELLPVHGAQVPPQAQESREGLPPPPHCAARQRGPEGPKGTGRGSTPGQAPGTRPGVPWPGGRRRRPGPEVPAAAPRTGSCGSRLGGARLLRPAQAPQDHQGNPPGRPRRPQVARCHTGPQAHEASQEPDPKGDCRPVGTGPGPGGGGSGPLCRPGTALRLRRPAAPGQRGPGTGPLVGTALVAHVHSLVKGHRPVLAHVDDEVPQLSPGHHHEGQVRAPGQEAAAHLSGAHPHRGLGLNRPPHRPPPQPKQPVQQGQEAKAQGGQAGYGVELARLVAPGKRSGEASMVRVRLS